MPKEYDDIKKQYADKNPDWDDKKVSEVASKSFKSIFGISVVEAIKLEKDGEWKSYLKEHSGKSAKSYSCKTQFVSSDMNLVKDGKKLYLEGFVSSEIPNDNGDAVPQQELINKINDPKDRLSKFLSDDHKWMKGDASDYKPSGYAVTPFELRYNPKSGTYDAYGKLVLDNTSERYDNLVYGVKSKKYKGFSIEYELFGSETEIIGDVVVNKWTDFNIIGIGVTPEPLQEAAYMSKYYAKSYNVIGGKNMDNNTGTDVNNNKEGGDAKDTTQPDAQPLNSNNNTNTNSGNQTDDTSKKYISKLEQEIAQIKEENNKIKTEKDNKELELKKKDLEKELDSLKAGNTVLIDKDSQSVTDQNPVGKDIVKEKLNQIYSNSKITTREKIRQVSNVVFK